MVDQLNAFSGEVTRVAREVGTEGKLGGQAQVPGAAGTWKDLTDNVNAMAANLTGQVRNIAEVTTAVAKGDLSKKITVDVKGEILELKSTINTMVDQLNAFSGEVTRVAREVGKGALSKKITVDVKGEILELKSTINTMVDQLNSFFNDTAPTEIYALSLHDALPISQVPGVAGTWKDLTDNVNAMAANLTGQVRNIAEVTTAVAKGDLSKKITVDVKGEILELKSTINTMVDQLNAFSGEDRKSTRLN